MKYFTIFNMIKSKGKYILIVFNSQEFIPGIDLDSDDLSIKYKECKTKGYIYVGADEVLESIDYDKSAMKPISHIEKLNLGLEIIN